MALTHFQEEVEAAQDYLDTLKPAQREGLLKQAADSPIRCDMVTLLTYVNDHSVVGTQSTGNLPLKIVGEIAARLVYPVKLEATTGTYTYRVRSEEDVWTIHYLHILADVGGLVSVGRARKWRVKKQGERFLAADPFTQTLYLLATWWTRVNWLVAYPYEGMGDHLPPFFSAVVRDELLDLPVKQRIAFVKFADQLINKAMLTWTAQESSFARMALQGAIERMVIYILRDFGMVTVEHRDKPLGKGTIKELAAFRITPLGQQLLEVL
ncbi:hypothetical protein ANRL3_01716 [Anaerolineae bacterium]|nr:hypothetical protein ANRL3_01716 [Anaerolineae bacterium]